MGTRCAKGHLRRIDGVVLSVVALDADIDHREAVDASGGHRLFDTALDSRDVVGGNRTADDRVDELAALAAVFGTDAELGDRVLTVPAGLLLDLALRLRLGGDRLSIGNAHVL